MTQAVENVQRKKDLAAMMAAEAGENSSKFNQLPMISVFNPSNDGGTNKFEPGEIIWNEKSADEWKNDTVARPFFLKVLKPRYVLKTKYAAKENGAPDLISDEFDSFSDNEIITVKIVDPTTGKYSVDFRGNYKEVTENYTIAASKFKEAEKILDLQIRVYCKADIRVGIKEMANVFFTLQVRGKNREAWFGFLKKFTRRDTDFLTATIIKVDSQKFENDYTGKPLRFPVYAFSFAKEREMTEEEMVQNLEDQKALNEAFRIREAMFAKEDDRTPVRQVAAQLGEGAKEDEIPTINLDDEEETIEIDMAIPGEELPKDANGEEVPFASGEKA